MTKVKMDAQYFIDKFTAIPEGKWTTGSYLRGDQCCALGHCGASYGALGLIFPEEARSLAELFLLYVEPDGAVNRINDYVSSEYPQPTPKARILAALEDVKKKGH